MLPLAAMNEAFTLLAGQRFYLAYAWEESQLVVCGHPLVGMPAPSAFVLDHRDGRQVDVHVYDMREGRVSALWDTDRTLRADLAAVGTINAVQIQYMSAAMQLVCHPGYKLPAAQPKTYAFSASGRFGLRVEIDGANGYVLLRRICDGCRTGNTKR